MCFPFFYFVVRARRRRKSSRSLSHLLMSFLLVLNCRTCNGEALVSDDAGGILLTYPQKRVTLYASNFNKDTAT